jgi:hypothetical protein
MRFRMLARVGAVLVVLAALTAAPGARAAPVLYDFSFTETASLAGGGSGNFSGRFTVENGLVIAVTGTSTRWGAITGIIAPGGYGNNNAFSPSSPWFTSGGVALTTNSRRVNVSGSGGAWFVATDPLTAFSFADSEGTLLVTLAATAPPTGVPAPASLALLAAGLLGLAAARAGRRAAPPAAA